MLMSNDKPDHDGPRAPEAGSPVLLTPAAGRTLRTYEALLVAIVLAFAIQGIASPGRWEQLFVTLLLGATLLLALRVARAHPRVYRAAVAAVLLLAVLSVAEAAAGSVDATSTRIANALLVALAPPAILAGVVRTLRATRTVTVEAVLGVLCVYLLLGMFFAFLYAVIARLGGAPFLLQGQTTTASLIYFSFTTLSTVGYGDLTARSNLGHTLAVSEALLGQVYLVTVVSLIVANLGRRRQSPP